jgi:hypothetical protein
VFNPKFLSLITENPQKNHLRTWLPFTLESVYQFSTQFKPKVEYSFLQGIFGPTVIDRAYADFLKVMPPKRC